MAFEDALEMEGKGAKSGLNPMFGEWRQRFSFDPVPYGNGAALRAFREKVRAELKNRFLFSGELHVTITLYLDVQTILETSETADVDNYAKAILDCLRGPDGIMFDDTQVQALWISWLDSHETYFTAEVRASPDDFVLKPVEFYEMPDRLWYPHGKRMWTDGAAEDTSDLSFYAGLLISEMMSGVQRNGRNEFRKGGMDRLRAYQTGKYFASSARGFHKSRIADAGFQMRSLAEWRAGFETWKEREPSKIGEVETILAGLREKWEEVTKAISGRE